MTLRFGLVGAGAIARSYVDVFAGVDGAAIVAVADPDARAADALAEAVRGTSFPSQRSMLEDAALDAVLVCAPPNVHHQLVLAAIEEGCHVLCEKPLALTGAAAREMLVAADQAGVLFAMATKFRFVDDVIRARQVVESGILGDLIQIENVFASRVDMSRRWNSDPGVGGGGVLIDNGTHSVDIARYFLGPIVEVLAVEGRRVQQLPVEDTVRVQVRTADGLLGSIDLSWSYDSVNETYLEVYGSYGTVKVGWQESCYRQASSSEWVPFGRGYDKISCMRNQVETFCRVLRGEGTPAVTPDDMLASVLVIEAAYASLETGEWTPVASTLAAPGASGEQVA
jgi:predicted dehydrogenase